MDEVLRQPDIQEALLERIKEYGIGGESMLMLRQLPLPKEVFSISKVQENGVYKIAESLNESITHSTEYGDYADSGITLTEKFREAGINIVESPKIVEKAQKVLLMRLRGKYEGSWHGSSHTYNPEQIIKIKRNFPVSEEFLSSENYRSALKEYITNSLRKGADEYATDPTQDILQFSEEFNLSIISDDEQVREEARKLFAEKTIKNELSNARKFLDIFHIPVENVLDEIKQEMGRSFQNHDLQRVVSLQDILSIKPETIRAILKPLIGQELATGNFEKVFQIKVALQLEDTLFSEIDANTSKQITNSSLIKFIDTHAFTGVVL